MRSKSKGKFKMSKDNEFPKKLLDKVPSNLVDTIPTMKEEELRERIVACEAAVVDLEEAQEDSDRIKVLKEELKDLLGGFRDAKKAEEATIKYCIWALKNQGVVLKKSD